MFEFWEANVFANGNRKGAFGQTKETSSTDARKIKGYRKIVREGRRRKRREREREGRESAESKGSLYHRCANPAMW